MPPKRFFSEIERQQIRDYVKQNNTVPMKTVAKTFGLPYKTFRKLAKELGIGDPNPYTFGKKELPSYLLDDIRQVLQEKPQNIRTAYRLFLKNITETPLVTKKGFEQLVRL